MIALVFVLVLAFVHSLATAWQRNFHFFVPVPVVGPGVLRKYGIASLFSLSLDQGFVLGRQGGGVGVVPAAAVVVAILAAPFCFCSSLRVVFVRFFRFCVGGCVGGGVRNDGGIVARGHRWIAAFSKGCWCY